MAVFQGLERLRAAVGGVSAKLLWRGAIALLGLITLAVLWRNSVTGDWFASGNDMRYILPELHRANSAMVGSWFSGPWIGHELFIYYRPITSLFMLGEFGMFGEHAAVWQAVSLVLHVIGVLLLADFLNRVFKNPAAALAGAAVWAFHDRIALAIAWTPAQTDIIAGFFFVVCIASFQRFLETRSNWLFGCAMAASLLSMGAKEVGLILPAVLTVLVFWQPGLSRKRKFDYLIVPWLLVVAFVAWRFHALKGMGYVPGQGHFNAGSTPQEYLKSLLSFILPASLGPTAAVGMAPAWLFALGFVGTSLMAWKRVKFWFAPALLGFAASILIIGPPLLIVPETDFGLLATLPWAFLLTIALIKKPRELAVALVWGFIVALPVLRTVFNSAGNVTYVASTYWALMWSVFAMAVFSLGRLRAPQPAVPEAASLELVSG